MAWKSFLVLAALIFSSCCILDMSSSVLEPSSIKELDESYAGFQYSVPGSGANLESSLVTSLKMIMASPDTCLDFQFNGSNIMDWNGETEAEEGETDEINLAAENDGIGTSVREGDLDTGGEEFANSGEMLDADREDSTSEHANGGDEMEMEFEENKPNAEENKGPVSELGETPNWVKSGEETGGQISEHDDKENDGFSSEEKVKSGDEINDDVHFPANQQLDYRKERGSWQPREIVMVVVASLVAVFSGIFFKKKKKKEVPLEVAESSFMRSKDKKVVERKSLTGNSPSMRLLDEYAVARVDAAKEENFKAEKRNYEDRLSMYSSKSYSSSTQLSTAESTSYGSFTASEYIAVKRKGGAEVDSDKVMTPVRRSSRIRNQVTSP